MKTLEELLEQDKLRELDGFPRRIRLGKLVKPSKDNKGKVIVVPSTTEPKFYHDDSVTDEEEGEGTGGAGEGEEGEVIGEQKAQPQPGEGEGQGAGEGDSASHDMSSEAYDLGKIITQKFELPNLKDKGKKRSFSKYTYDLTDQNRGFGQLLDKKATLRRVIKSNILLENIKPGEPFNPENLLINPQDTVYRILSQEKDFETQAVVFFLRDYSGSMQGDPTQLVTTQHLLIYSWLMYQYQNNVMTRFIVHDTEAKEVPDFYSYYTSQVAGGTKVAPAFKLMNKIIEEEQLMTDYNIYVFYGTDGDDWDSDGKELIAEIRKTLQYANRLGITVAKNSWTPDDKTTTVEKNIESSGLLKEKSDLIKMDGMSATNVSEERIIEGIKKLVS
ncbi:MAG: hypothetical protein A2W91_18960 [Bacteroidetes bacterium GWF2_38_335]|nr:MAG: hypothetical protein A2W91_18960 [Bacteroidetes bacterium GWF2_38_335]OFY80263.1 MAG: hypothetical protein A2281_17235 [Bacteroidetes bacterium RIFOXYA12_FULL_38_20]